MVLSRFIIVIFIVILLIFCLQLLWLCCLLLGEYVFGEFGFVVFLDEVVGFDVGVWLICCVGNVFDQWIVCLFEYWVVIIEDGKEWFVLLVQGFLCCVVGWYCWIVG